MKPFEKNIQLKKGDIIEILFYDNEIDYVKVKDDNTNKIKVIDEKKTIKRIRVRRPLSEHLDEIIFNSDNEIKEDKTMELKDIVLKKGDIIYFKNGDKRIKLDDIDHKVGQISPEFFLINDIVKIERPIKYETIYETPKEILDKEEKEYLEAVIRPFKHRVKGIKMRESAGNFISIYLENEIVSLPYFKKGTIYKGMEPYKDYTLEELGLFKEQEYVKNKR